MSSLWSVIMATACVLCMALWCVLVSILILGPFVALTGVWWRGWHPSKYWHCVTVSLASPGSCWTHGNSTAGERPTDKRQKGVRNRKRGSCKGACLTLCLSQTPLSSLSHTSTPDTSTSPSHAGAVLHNHYLILLAHTLLTPHFMHLYCWGVDMSLIHTFKTVNLLSYTYLHKLSPSHTHIPLTPHFSHLYRTNTGPSQCLASLTPTSSLTMCHPHTPHTHTLFSDT